jgi:hypothetical protein
MERIERAAAGLPARGASDCSPLAVLVRALGRAQLKDADAFVLNVLEHSDSNVAAAAVRALPRVATARIAGPLAERLAKEAAAARADSEPVKALVLVEALRKAPSDEGGAALVACVKGRNLDLALRAAEALAVVRALARTAELVQLHNALAEGELRRALGRSLRAGRYPVVFDARRKTFRVKPER